jgi:ATP-binding cassette subfamily B protein
LNFKYLDSEEQNKHLDGVDFKVNQGEKIACIGKSGSGKTTFLKVVHGLYENATSIISFDEKESFQTNFSNLDLKTMLVPQEPELFSSSIRENITFGLDYSDIEIMKVLDLAEFSEVLNSLPRGLGSVVNEKGVNLSGGQKQRLALARALLFSADKEIILLDESTSSVDPKSEVKIYQNIFKQFPEKTFIASIHKMNLLKYFDRIVIFENGKIVDEGTFDSLCQSNNDFKKQ